MGHCLSCFQNQVSNTNGTPLKKKDDVTDTANLSQNSVPVVSDYTQNEPLLQDSEIGANFYTATDKDNHQNANLHFMQGDHIPVRDIRQEMEVVTEKASKSLNRRLPTIPISMPSIETIEPKVSESKINNLFNQYKDSVEEAILAEGIENLCNDLELNPDDFKVLVLAWKLNASQMCRFTQAEFTQGLKNLKTDSIKGIQEKLHDITDELKDDTEQFKDLYRFTFKFGLDVNSGQRILPSDIAQVLWRLVFTNNEPPILQKWLSYLESHPHIRGVPKDTWYMFLNFCEFVGDDLSSYDDTEAWPSLFDDFVEFENDQMNQNIKNVKSEL